jgi:Glycosyltransferase family 87
MMHRRAAGHAALIAIVLATVGFLGTWAIARDGFDMHGRYLDTPRYAAYGQAIRDGRVPYRDFAVEYPPLALPSFVLPALVAPGASYEAYEPWFELLMGLLGAAAAALGVFVLSRLEVSRRRLALAAVCGALLPLPAAALVLSRYDLWPALLTVGALAALISGRERLGFGALALAVAAKAYPVVILPIALSFVWRRVGSRRAATCMAVFAAVLGACLVPFALLSPHGLWTAIHGQASRPLQLESFGASLMLAAHQFFGTHLSLLISHHSYNLSSTAAGDLPTILTAVQTAAVLGVWLLFASGPATPQRLVLASAAAICAFIVFDRVLSPQYLLWLVPLVISLPGRRAIPAIALLAGALLLTRLWYPFHVPGLEQFAPRESWLVVSRDALLLGLLGTLVWPDVYRLIASRASRAPTFSSGPTPSLSARALIDGRP